MGNTKDRTAGKQRERDRVREKWESKKRKKEEAGKTLVRRPTRWSWSRARTTCTTARTAHATCHCIAQGTAGPDSEDGYGLERSVHRFGNIAKRAGPKWRRVLFFRSCFSPLAFAPSEWQLVPRHELVPRSCPIQQAMVQQ
jgi:hypothetical protein